MKPDNAFGQAVRQHRRSLDLTQEELARRVGCAPVTLRKIEYGDLRPSQQIAERLAMALAIPLDERAEFVRQARAVQPGAAPESPSLPQVSAEEIGLEDLSGRAIRGYTLGEKIGAGAFGAVYRAVQPLVEREVAIKIILPKYANHPDFIRRFEAEAQLVARLEHPHIVPLYDYWREPGVAYLVMRLLRGGNVQDLIERGPLALDQIARLLDQIGSALQAAHRSGVLNFVITQPTEGARHMRRCRERRIAARSTPAGLPLLALPKPQPRSVGSLYDCGGPRDPREDSE